MSIVDHEKAPEIPWRPNYRVWTVAGEEDGVECTLHYSTLEPGSGAPLHTHDVDELITILEGAVEGRIGEEARTVVANQTMVIPKGIAHGFTASGSVLVKALAYFPGVDVGKGTRYLEGEPPAAYR